MAKVDANADRAVRLLQALQEQKQGGAGYPPSADELRRRTDASMSDAELLKSLAHKTIAGQVVLAAKKDVAAPVALAGDEELLARSDELVRFALGRLATAAAPLHPARKVVGKVEAPLRPAFEASLAERAAAKALPAGVGVREVSRKQHFYLDDFPPPPPPRSPAERLADDLLARLRELSDQGADAVLLSDLVVGKVSAPALKAALAAEPFTRAAVVIPVSRAEQVVGLDQAAVLASARLLSALLAARTSAKKPAIRPDALADALPEADRGAFRDALRDRIAGGRLPEGVRSRPGGDDLELLLLANLPAAERIAGELLALLRSAHAGGSATYPCRLGELFARVEVDPQSKLGKQVLAEGALASGAVVAVAGQADSPVALAGDHDVLLRDRRLVEVALGSMRSDDTQAVALADLGKKVVRELRPSFTALAERQVIEGALPAGVGCLRIKKKPHLFLLADLGVTPAAAAPAPTRQDAGSAPVDFARLFDEAFERLDRERGAHNLVSLVQLRREVPLGRDRFDDELTGLRRAGRYSLVGAEGRHGLTEEERAAGIVEHGNLLLFVSRREG